MKNDYYELSVENLEDLVKTKGWNEFVKLCQEFLLEDIRDQLEITPKVRDGFSDEFLRGNVYAIRYLLNFPEIMIKLAQEDDEITRDRLNFLEKTGRIPS